MKECGGSTNSCENVGKREVFLLLTYVFEKSVESVDAAVHGALLGW